MAINTAISEYRARRQARIDSRKEENKARSTVLGEDNIVKGLGAKNALDRKIMLSEAISPSRFDYVGSDNRNEWVSKNLGKLRGIYSDSGVDGIKSEWRKYRMDINTKDLHEVSEDDAKEALRDAVRREAYDGWYGGADSEYKPELVGGVLSNKNTRNAALNLAYQNYKDNVSKPVSFERFLIKPITVYRGVNGRKETEDDVFDVYTFNRVRAEKDAGIDGDVLEVRVRPVDTYGSMKVSGNEMWVPRELIGNRKVEDKSEEKWERYNPIKWAFEDKKDDGSADLLEAIIREAEMIKLFANGDKDVSKQVTERCTDAILKTVLQITAKYNKVNEDSAFFAGELNDDLGDFYVQYPEVRAFRERRKNRLDSRLDDEWKTIKGTHVLVDEEGNVTKGPDALKKANDGLSEEMQPVNDDYDFDPNDGFDEFSHKNVDKLMGVYEEKGREGIEDEWYKTRLQNCSKDFKEISGEEIDKVLWDNDFDERAAHMWLREYDNDIKPRLIYELTKNGEVHNACLNIMYENYKNQCEVDKTEPFSYDEFLTTPIKMYRGGSGKEYKHASPFSSYTFNRKAAERFKNGPTGYEAEKDGVIYEAEIRPIDTYGSLNTSGEMEIFVPRMIAPNGRRDEDDVREDAEDEGRWITTDNGHHVHLNEEGEPDKGNEHVIEKMEGGSGRKKKQPHEVLKEKYKKSLTADKKAELVWDFFERLPVGTKFELGPEMYEKTGDDEYLIPEYDMKFDLKGMVEDSHLMLPTVDERDLPEIVEYGKGNVGRRKFPEEQREIYKQYELAFKVEDAGERFNDVASKGFYGDSLSACVSEKDFDKMVSVLNELPIGAAIKGGFRDIYKIRDNLYMNAEGFIFNEYDVVTDALSSENKKSFEMVDGSMKDALRFALDKMPDLDDDFAWSGIYYENKVWALQRIDSYKNDVLFGLDDESIGDKEKKKMERDLNRICEKMRGSVEKRSAEYRDAVKKRFPTFNDCKTNEEVERRLHVEEIFSLNDKPKFGNKISTRSAIQISEDIMSFAEKNPIYKGHMHSVRVSKIAKDDYYKDGVYGRYAYGHVELNDKWYGNLSEYKESFDSSVRTGFHPSGLTYRSVVSHEYSHGLDDYFGKRLREKGVIPKSMLGDFSDVVFDEVYEYYSEKDRAEGHESGTHDICTILSSVSQYSLNNKTKAPYAEFFAEAYSEYLCSESPRETARVVGGIVEKYSKKLEGK